MYLTIVTLFIATHLTTHFILRKLDHHKKAFRNSRPQPGCHLTNSPWAGIMTSYINYSRLGRVCKQLNLHRYSLTTRINTSTRKTMKPTWVHENGGHEENNLVTYPPCPKKSKIKTSWLLRIETEEIFLRIILGINVHNFYNISLQMCSKSSNPL